MFNLLDKMSFLTLILFLYSCTNFLFVDAYYCPKGDPVHNFPVVRKKPYSFPTYIPISYNTSAAYKICVPTLHISIYKNCKLNCTNSGSGVSCATTKWCTPATLTGGCVYNDKYKLNSIGYDIDAIPTNTRVAMMRDGVGTPVQFGMSFYNADYGSYLNAQKYRDGTVSLPFAVNVIGTVDNPHFTPLLSIFKKISSPYTTAFISVFEASYWLLRTFVSGNPYFCFPGAIITAEGEFIFCQNNILPSTINTPWISYPQYKTLLNVKNKFNQPNCRVRVVFPVPDERPFVETVNPKARIKYHD